MTALSQIIFTSTSMPHVTLADKVKVAGNSVTTCNLIGLTGRVLVVPEMAINVMEGPKTLLNNYVEAIRRDEMIDLLIIHNSQPIKTHEFEDYSVWMTYKSDEPMEGVYRLMAENFETALPKTVSLKTRLFIEGNINIDEAAA